MPIISIDLQTLIPKMPEVQKTKSVEAETPQNNNNINLHKEQQQIERNTKQVYKKDNASGTRINRDQQKKNQHQSQGEKNNDNNDGGSQKEKDGSSAARPKTKIDIRI